MKSKDILYDIIEEDVIKAKSAIEFASVLDGKAENYISILFANHRKEAFLAGIEYAKELL